MRYLFPIIPLIGAAVMSVLASHGYALLLYLICAFVFLIGLLVILRGRIRDLVLVAASLLLCFIGVELYQVLTDTRSLPDKTAFGLNPILGWAPVSPGKFHARKVDAKTGKVIFDVTYTIDKDLERATASSDSGPTVAFFGDSFTYGEGLPDSETLPQAFSDLEHRKLHVLNLGGSGYGPQQFLRALETGMLDDRLRNSRLFVFETAPWHAERASCSYPNILRAPRYVLKDGRPTYVGACAEGLTRMVREALDNSALYRAIFPPAYRPPSRADIELYIAIIARAVEIARDTHHVPTLILYLRFASEYLANSGYNDDSIMQKLREAGADVIDGSLDPADHPGLVLNIPGDGHPTGAANLLRAKMIKAWCDRHPELFPASSSH